MTDTPLTELLVFSDHHAHPFTYNAEEVRGGDGVLTNSRLLNSCKVIDQMHSYAKKHDIKTVVFGGDLFHTREAVPTDAYNMTLKSLYRLVCGRDAYLLAGNHDYHDRAGLIHSLEGLKYWPGMTVVDWRSELQMDAGACYFTFVPYTEDKQQALDALKNHAALRTDSPKLLFAHLGMQGATVGSDHVLVHPSDVSVGDVQFLEFTACFFGHYHQHQKLFPNGWYIGATHHHTWGDVNTRRGFLHVRVYPTRVDFDFIESDAPRFIGLSESDVDDAEIRDQDFVRVFTQRKESSVREKVKSDKCEVIYVPPELSLKKFSLDETNLDPSAMIETWVKANEDWLKEHMPDLADPAELVNYGRMILSKVQDK